MPQKSRPDIPRRRLMSEVVDQGGSGVSNLTVDAQPSTWLSTRPAISR